MNSKRLTNQEMFEDDEDFANHDNTPVTGEKIYWDDHFKAKGFKEKISVNFSVFRSRIRHAYYDFIAGIKSFWRWRKVIWKDRTWGNHQILDVLIFKLKIDAEAMRRNNRVEGSNDMYNEMMKVATLLENYNSKDYFTEYKKQHDAKWGEDRHYFLELKSGSYEWKSERDKVVTEEDLKLEGEEYFALRDKAEAERNNDLNEALKIMSEKIEYWWD